MAIMTDPYKAECGHHFSRAIFQLISNNNGSCECPVAGCRRFISKTSLSRDLQLAKKIQRHLKQQEEDRMNQSFMEI